LRPSSANNQRGFRIKKNTPPPKLNLEDEVYMQRYLEKFLKNEKK
jgi:hypothetical protein